ncbi:hypothetical protein AAZX31_02G095200 [Glycine max]
MVLFLSCFRSAYHLVQQPGNLLQVCPCHWTRCELPHHYSSYASQYRLIFIIYL